MKIILFAKHSYENQLTVENVEEAVEQSAFDVTEVLVMDDPDEIGKLWAEQENLPYSEYKIDWKDLTNCPNPKKGKYGLYNPLAPKQRTERIVQDCDGMILFWHEFDTQSSYLINDLKKVNKRVYFHKPDVEFII